MNAFVDSEYDRSIDREGIRSQGKARPGRGRGESKTKLFLGSVCLFELRKREKIDTTTESLILAQDER